MTFPLPRAALQDLLDGIDGGEVLDVGTGAGGFIAALAAGLRSHTGFTGVDTNPAALADARRQHPGVRFEQADAARLPFPDRVFDAVALSNSLHHLPDLPAVFRELRRVARPGATLIIREMYRDHQPAARLTHVLAHDWWAEVNTSLGEYHRPGYTRQELLDIIDGLGLTRTRTAELATEDGDPFDPDGLAQFALRNRRMLEKTRDKPGFAAHEARCAQLIARARAVGVLPSATLAAIGRLPA